MVKATFSDGCDDVGVCIGRATRTSRRSGMRLRLIGWPCRMMPAARAPSPRVPSPEESDDAHQTLRHRALDERPGDDGHLEHRRDLRGFCLLYTSDAADDLLCVDLGGRRI